MGPQMALADATNLVGNNEDPSYFLVADEVFNSILNQQEKGLYIHGQPGVGKSYLAAAMTNYFARLGRRVAFLSVPTLSQKIKNSFDDPEYKDHILSVLRNVPILVMDDKGAESVTSWFRDEILFPILNFRMEAKKTTWFTSNESLESLKNHYMYNQRAEKEEMKAVRIMERIETLAKPLFLGGKNRRRM
jgi:primosomal protein DnaI